MGVICTTHWIGILPPHVSDDRRLAPPLGRAPRSQSRIRSATFSMFVCHSRGLAQLKVVVTKLLVRSQQPSQLSNKELPFCALTQFNGERQDVLLARWVCAPRTMSRFAFAVGMVAKERRGSVQRGWKAPHRGRDRRVAARLWCQKRVLLDGRGFEGECGCVSVLCVWTCFVR